MLDHVLADGRGQGQTDIGIHVDFADAHGGGPAQHVFRHAAGVAYVAAVLVAFLDELMRHGRGAVEDERIVGKLFADGFKAGEVEFGFALKLVGAVAGADGDGQGVASGLFDEVDSLIRVGELMPFGLHVLFDAGELAEFGLNPHASRMGVVDDLLGQGHVFLIGQG